MTQYTCVKTSFLGRVKEGNEKFKDAIEALVQDVSKAAHRGSLIFNRLLLTCLQNNKPLPDLTDQNLYRHIFTVGKGRISTDKSNVKKIYEDYFKAFPIDDKPKHGAQSYSYLSRKYRTNFYNSLTYTFWSRQKYHVKNWCKKNGKEDYRYIISKINNWKTNRIIDLDNDCKNFIDKEREKLNQPKYLNDHWLNNNLETVLKYYYYILPTQERKFTLAPICKIKRHFITIDNDAFVEIIQERKYKGKERPKTKEWSDVFDLKGLRNKLEFGNMIVTDGVTISFLFEKKQGTGKKKVIDINPDKVIGLDPGRSNLAFCTNGKKSYRLTRKEYYVKSGMNQRKRKAAHYETKINYQGMNTKEYSLKTLDLEVYKKYVDKYSSIHSHIWKEKLKKCRARDTFRVYCLKNKLLDRFFGQFKDHTVAYGSAKFNSTGRHEVAVPTTFMYKKCIQHCNTVLVNEHNTTKMCFTCKENTSAVSEVRGLRWCTTNCHRLINRDLNAALNIRSCLPEEKRHKNLSGDFYFPVIQGSYCIVQ